MKTYFSSGIYFFILEAIVTLSLQENDGKGSPGLRSRVITFVILGPTFCFDQEMTTVSH